MAKITGTEKQMNLINDLVAEIDEKAAKARQAAEKALAGADLHKAHTIRGWMKNVRRAELQVELMRMIMDGDMDQIAAWGQDLSDEDYRLIEPFIYAIHDLPGDWNRPIRATRVISALIESSRKLSKVLSWLKA